MRQGYPDNPVLPAADPEGGGRSPGITLREHYAGLALQAVIIAKGQGGIRAKEAALKAVEYADELAQVLQAARRG